MNWSNNSPVQGPLHLQGSGCRWTFLHCSLSNENSPEPRIDSGLGHRMSPESELRGKPDLSGDDLTSKTVWRLNLPSLITSSKLWQISRQKTEMSIKLDTYGGVKNFFHFDQCFDLFHRILQIRGKNIFKNTKPHHLHLKMHVVDVDN